MVTLVILLASKAGGGGGVRVRVRGGGGGGFPSESQSLLQRYTITIFTARLFYQRMLVTRAMRQPIISPIAFLYRDRDQSKLLEHFTAFLPSQSMLV